MPLSPDERRAYAREWARRKYHADPETARAKAREAYHENHEREKTRSLAWYHANREKLLARNKTDEGRRRKREYARADYYHSWWQTYRATLDLTCQRCGDPHPNRVNFHHRDPATRLFPVSFGYMPSRYTREEVLAELEKCDVLCARCHTMHHWDIRLGRARYDT